MRGMTLAISSDSHLKHLISHIFLLCAALLGTAQMITINRLMRIYSQLEIQPVYQTSLILFNLFCGAIILDEQRLYTNVELARLFAYCMICILGVIILIKKPSFLNKSRNENIFAALNEAQSPRKRRSTVASHLTSKDTMADSMICSPIETTGEASIDDEGVISKPVVQDLWLHESQELELLKIKCHIEREKVRGILVKIYRKENK